MKRPIEHEYNSFVSYARELEKYCSELEAAATQALEALEELADIVTNAVNQKSAADLDSFTLQPAYAAITTLTAALENK